MSRESALGDKKSISNYAIPHIWDFPSGFTQMWGRANSHLNFAKAMSDSLLLQK